MELKKITAAEDKRRMAREVLEALPDWFGIEETRGYLSHTLSLIKLFAQIKTFAKIFTWSPLSKIDRMNQRI